MTEDQLDDALKNKIRDHRSPVPDDMWERIQKKDKDRKGFLFLFGGITVLIVGVCLGGYLWMNHTKQKPEPVVHAVSGRDQNSNKTIPPSNLNNKETKTEENIPAVAQHLPADKEGSNSSRPFPAGKKGSDYSNKPGKSKDKEENFKSVIDKTTVSGAAVSEALAGAAHNLSSEKDSLEEGKDDSVLNAKGVVNQPVAIVKPVPEKSPADTARKTADKKTQKDSAAAKKWYLDVYASPDRPMDHMGFTFSSFRPSYTIGLRINRTFGEHFSGKIGIQYSQINFSNSDSIHYLIGPVNNLKSWDIPFLAGYSLGAEKLKMTITFGGIANLSTFTADSVYTIFKKNTGLSLYLGFNMEKKINQKISVYLEPYYTYRLTPMTIDGIDYFKYINVVGLSFGARFYFLKTAKK